MVKEKQTIRKEDVGDLDMSQISTFNNIKKVGKFDRTINNNSLIQCPKCLERWGAKKWERLCGGKKMKCPGCVTVFDKGTEFVSTYLDREFEAPSVPGIPTVRLSASVTTKDTLIRKDE